MVVYHEANPVINHLCRFDHILRSQSNPIDVQELMHGLCRTISSKISLISLLSLPSDLSVSIVAVPTVLVHKVAYREYGTYLIFVAGSTHEN